MAKQNFDFMGNHQERQCYALTNNYRMGAIVLMFFPNAQCPIPNSQCPIPNSQCPIPNAQFPMPNSPFPIPHSPFPIPHS
ncbi:MAG: hypothetical protein F6K31_23220 [Symploca sp. SIO2G7]|nr:hypothetical protein [Symploca sp. SIO2G7]